MSITVHTIIKNEENYITYGVKSVIDFVDKVIIFDTGSEDKTVELVKNLVREYPNKIIFEEKGACDKKKHTQLRQEMIARTDTEWFMILDGDEVWTKRAMQEAIQAINGDDGNLRCIMSTWYQLVGDVRHRTFHKGNYSFLGRTGYFSPQFYKIADGAHWSGDYGADKVVNSQNDYVFSREGSYYFLKNKYWHASQLERSSSDAFTSFGQSRKSKEIDSYFLIGRKINEDLPEVFDKEFLDKNCLSRTRSFFNFFRLVGRRTNFF